MSVAPGQLSEDKGSRAPRPDSLGSEAQAPAVFRFKNFSGDSDKQLLDLPGAKYHWEKVAPFSVEQRG